MLTPHRTLTLAFREHFLCFSRSALFYSHRALSSPKKHCCQRRLTIIIEHSLCCPRALTLLSSINTHSDILEKPVLHDRALTPSSKKEQPNQHHKHCQNRELMLSPSQSTGHVRQNSVSSHRLLTLSKQMLPVILEHSLSFLKSTDYPHGALTLLVTEKSLLWPRTH